MNEGKPQAALASDSPGGAPRAFPAILWGGLIAGVFDITYAILFSMTRGLTPQRVLQSVASGLLGRDAYDGGSATAALGLLLHFTIALIWATLFVAASRRWPALTRHAVPAGILYGVLVYFAMNFLVLPLSAFPHKPSYTALSLARNLLVHMFLIGLPIALAARRFARRA